MLVIRLLLCIVVLYSSVSLCSADDRFDYDEFKQYLTTRKVFPKIESEEIKFILDSGLSCSVSSSDYDRLLDRLSNSDFQTAVSDFFARYNGDPIVFNTDCCTIKFSIEYGRFIPDYSFYDVLEDLVFYKHTTKQITIKGQSYHVRSIFQHDDLEFILSTHETGRICRKLFMRALDPEGDLSNGVGIFISILNQHSRNYGDEVLLAKLSLSSDQ